MKKKKNIFRREEVVNEDDDTRGLEIVKAVAQAWYSHYSVKGSNTTSNEFDARKRSFRGRNPTRFKLEATKNKPRGSTACFSSSNGNNESNSWDFARSLWDSYEIVTLSKRLEEGLVLDGTFSEIRSDKYGGFEFDKVHMKRRESKNSLRSFFSQMTSKRFAEL